VGEVPGVDDDVAEHDHGDGALDGLAARRAGVELTRGDVGVVEQGLDRTGQLRPGTGRIVVDRRPGGQLHARGAQERGHPVDEMTHDVAGHPALAGSGVVPRGGRHVIGAVAEASGHTAEALGGDVGRCELG
jgi:hypothetical protein